MYGVIERRRQYLLLMRQITLEMGHFTVNDFQAAADVPRSTAQDWINRLVSEGCVIVKEKKQGRIPARYVAVSAVPASACRRIFTTVDGDWVEIYHDCMSGACAAFCGYHHRRAGGALTHIQREGTLLRECARIGRSDITIGLYPSAAVGVTGVRREGGTVVQEIRCIGGPAYSLSDMMSGAQGVEKVRIRKKGALVEGEVYTRAMSHIIIGIDDTDSPTGGATFAIALALLQHISGMDGVIPIGHHIAMLYPSLPEKTAGNSCSFIDIAVEPEKIGTVKDRVVKFVQDEAISPEWGIAMKIGFRIPAGLRKFGSHARSGPVTLESAVSLAREYDVALYGGRGVIGALAGISLWGLDNAVLLNAEAEIPA